MNTIQLEGTGCYFRWTCDVCGELQEKDGMRSRIVIEDEPNVTLDICKTCLDAGPDGAIERALKSAEELEELARSIREDYPRVIKGISEWKTGADYDNVQAAWELEFEKECAKDEGLSLEEWREKHKAVFSTPPVTPSGEPDWAAMDNDEFPF
jgi:hypothetical protein